MGQNSFLVEVELRQVRQGNLALASYRDKVLILFASFEFLFSDITKQYNVPASVATETRINVPHLPPFTVRRNHAA